MISDTELMKSTGLAVPFRPVPLEGCLPKPPFHGLTISPPTSATSAFDLL